MSTIGYQRVYNNTFEAAQAVAAELERAPSSTINATLNTAGGEGVRALFDALMDTGMRHALSEALRSPALSGAVREQLEGVLYGGAKQPAFLLSRRTLH